ncbi:MAG: cell division protein ZapA [Deltaproteobacteria bacterium]|nr:cell division protein ZapA [Deltaproteobacteria bacterium]
MKKAYNIVVFGMEISVRSEADESQVSALAEYLQRKYDEVKSVSQNAPRANLMALAALNVASDYFEVRDSAQVMQRALEARSKRIISKIDQLELPKEED